MKEDIKQSTLDIVSLRLAEPGALLPILHALQDHFNYIPAESVPLVANALNLSRAEVYGVISFYDWFQSERGGEKTVYICRAEACQAMGGAAVEAAAKELLGIDYHQTSGDGRVTLQPVYCLGNCACSPNIMIDDKLYGRVTPQSMTDLLTEVAEQES